MMPGIWYYTCNQCEGSGTGPDQELALRRANLHVLLCHMPVTWLYGWDPDSLMPPWISQYSEILAYEGWVPTP